MSSQLLGLVYVIGILYMKQIRALTCRHNLTLAHILL